MPKINALPYQLDAVMSYAELEALHRQHQLDAESVKFYYAVNRRHPSMSYEQAFLTQKEMALNERLRRDQLRCSAATNAVLTTTIPSQVSTPAVPTLSPGDIRKCRRTVMEVLRFEPLGHSAPTGPRLPMDLAPSVQHMLARGELTEGQARILVLFPKTEDQQRLAKTTRDDNLSVYHMCELIGTSYSSAMRHSCPSLDSRIVCHWILELWSRGQILSDHVRWLLCEIMSTRVAETMGHNEYSEQRRIAARENSCFISRTFVQGPFVPAFYDVDNYEINAPLCSPDGIFHFIWLHRKETLAVLDDVLLLVLDLHGETEATCFLKMIGLDTRPMASVAATQAFQGYFDGLRVQLKQRLQELDEQYRQILASSEDMDMKADGDDNDEVGNELRSVAAQLEVLDQHQTTVELHEEACQRAEEEEQKQEERRRDEDEKKQMRKSDTFKALVRDAVEAKNDEIWTKVMVDFDQKVQQTVEKRMKAVKRKIVLDWNETVADGVAEHDYAQSLIRKERQQDQGNRRERLTDTDRATRQQQRQRRREKSRLRLGRKKAVDVTSKHIPLLLSADELNVHETEAD